MNEKFYEAPGAIRRFAGESFASFSARQRASQLAAKPAARKPRVRMKRDPETYESKLDDLGESPDY